MIDYIRFNEVPLEQLDTIFLLNREAVLAGTVPLAKLLLAGPEDEMKTLGIAAEVSVGPNVEDKEVFEIFDKYNLRSLAVVDDEGHPIGAIAVDDVVERMRAKL